QYSTEKKWDNLTVRVYDGADGEFVLYEDENDNYNYEKEKFSTITFKWNNQEKTLSVGDRIGNFKGMLSTRKFNVVLIADGKSPGRSKSITYNGKLINMKL
ncbi:MAG: DUF5110 domain-containing protein, partial [Pedobacter sp.]